MGKDNKFEAMMTVREVSDFLRQLASRLEGCTSDDMPQVLKETAEIEKIKLGFKKKGQPDQMAVKIKVEYAKSEGEARPQEEPSNE